ncbi:MAG: hypothetical protein ACK4PR_01780 [Gammaproteobacteria bacterium]
MVIVFLSIHTILFIKDDFIQYIVLALDDEAQWVRVSAAKILASLGEEGRALLETHIGQDTLETPQEPAYFLKIKDSQASHH